MSNENPDDDLTEDQKVAANVMMKLVEAGWIEKTARRGSTVNWIPTPKGVQAAALIREVISKFGAAGMGERERAALFWMLIQKQFSAPGVQRDPPSGDLRR